jgi:deoxyribodipyrimidine photo-lyase
MAVTNNTHSPYLAAGVISARECVRATLGLLGKKKVQADRDSGIGMWVQEIGKSSTLCFALV